MFCSGFGRFGVGIHRASESSSLSFSISAFARFGEVHVQMSGKVEFVSNTISSF
jgi:hypothetical protein